MVNGEMSVNINAKLDQKRRVSIVNNKNELRQSINLRNKDVHALSKKHRVILIGDSPIKGNGCNFKLLLSNNYELYSVAKPGSSSSELVNTAKEEFSQLCHEDVIIIYCGTNDYEANEFSLTQKNISQFIQANKHTNIILLNIPFRYDLRNSASVNSTISTLNRKLKKLVKVSPQASFLETDNNRNSFTNHGHT
jgi:predicted nucleic-acid-binding Zn-ribbon protein